MKLGAFGEAWAAGYLERQGYRIVESNVRYRFGEIDLVALHGEEVVFVEVKTRRSGTYGTGLEAVDARKISRLTKAIEMYVRDRGIDGEYRLDVLAIDVDRSGRVSGAELVRGVGLS